MEMPWINPLFVLTTRISTNVSDATTHFGLQTVIKRIFLRDARIETTSGFPRIAEDAAIVSDA